MICDDCFEKEVKAQKADEEHADYWNEQYHIRYNKTAILDNELGKISVLYHSKVLRTWNYKIFDLKDENARRKSKIEARGYLEGWIDAIEVGKRLLREQGK
jgi:hypothetical protein